MYRIAETRIELGTTIGGASSIQSAGMQRATHIPSRSYTPQTWSPTLVSEVLWKIPLACWRWPPLRSP